MLPSNKKDYHQRSAAEGANLHDQNNHQAEPLLSGHQSPSHHQNQRGLENGNGSKQHNQVARDQSPPSASKQQEEEIYPASPQQENMFDQDHNNSRSKRSTNKNMPAPLRLQSHHNIKFENFNEDEESTKIYQIIGLETSFFKCCVIVPILALCTGLFFLLFLYWYPSLRKKMFYNECGLNKAKFLFILGTMGHMEIVNIQNRNEQISQFLNTEENRQYLHHPFLTFTYRFIQFEYDYTKDTFMPIVFNSKLPYQQIHANYSAGVQNQSSYLMQLIKYGKCNIEVPIKSIPRLLIEEVLNPFYLFQIFSMALWYWDGYQAYASCILIISVCSALTSLVETLRNLRSIRKMAHYSCPVNVMRSGIEDELTMISSEELVPGDVIEVPEMTNMPCDLILLTGSCIVNESMLTGESIPVIKNPLPFTNDVYDVDSDSKYTLYGGTKVIQTRKFGKSRVLGLVIRTAFVTTKGNLVRDILYPKPNKFKFYQDSLKFILVMGVIAVLGFLGTLPFMIAQGYEPWAIIDRSLDLVTITVPPALPAAMTVGTVFAINRLKRKKIFCISPPRVNVSGRVNLMVFDKTGTLTEDGLQVFGFRGVESATINNKQVNVFGSFTPDCKSYQPSHQWWQDKLDLEQFKENTRTLFLESLASCHAITYVNGELIGDPLDVKMFQATGWQLDENMEENNADELILAQVRPQVQTNLYRQQRADSMLSQSDISVVGGSGVNYSLALIRRFDFSSKLQRSSVIVKNMIDGEFRSYVKGSPERIRELCNPNSMPDNFDEILQIYTECGYRVLALATKALNLNFVKAQKILREEVESDIQFLGLLIMQNKLKPVTTSIIQTLNQAKIRTIMATGDNVLTAISVGRECNIIDGESEVFLGDVRKDEYGNEVVFWKSTKSNRHQLQPNNLVPDKQFYQDESQRPGHSHPHLSNQQMLESSRLEDEESVNDIVSLDDFPWQHPPEAYSIAITGRAFNLLVQDASQLAILQQVLLKAQIYARMSPDDKAKLVEQLQQYCKTEVGMCGDGANDCGALKTADIGISLSEAEASIAAPFTSQIQDISSVVLVLKEGRCALTTSFQMFKFIELYSMIQFVNVTYLYIIASNLTDYQFLYIDLFILVPLSMFMGQTAPYKHLTPHLPSGSLISLPVLTSVLGSVVVQGAFQIFMFYFIQWWSFYKPPPTPDPNDPDSSMSCYENTSMFLTSLYQYLTVAIAFSLSKPFRQPIYTNLWFTISLLILFVFSLYITLASDSWIETIFELKEDITMEFRLSLLVICFINSICTYLYEKIAIWYISLWWKSKKDHKRQLKIQQEIEAQQQDLEGYTQKVPQYDNSKKQNMKPNSQILNSNSYSSPQNQNHRQLNQMAAVTPTSQLSGVRSASQNAAGQGKYAIALSSHDANSKRLSGDTNENNNFR